MRINSHRRELSVKVVYYGPGMSGKTTNLKKLHEACARAQRGALVQLDTESERTLFFDYFPLAVGNIRGFKVKVDFFTVPGQSFYHATRRAVLEGVDGLVFVADSQAEREEANLISRADLIQNLQQSGRTLSSLPHVYQWNKRDAARPLSLPLMESLLNPEQAPSIAAVASDGAGVWETQNTLLRVVFERLRGHAEPERKHA